MSSTARAKIKATPVRDFNDAGTGESFAAGVEHEFEPGALANYRAAGLIAPEVDAPASA